MTASALVMMRHVCLKLQFPTAKQNRQDTQARQSMCSVEPTALLCVAANTTAFATPAVSAAGINVVAPAAAATAAAAAELTELRLAQA